MTRKEAIEILESVSFFAPSDIDVDTAIDMAIEALERPHGEWMYLYEDNYKCSICGSWWCCTDSQIDEMNYCPNCGARMDEDDDNDDN